jgi:DNA-binding MarR family transcriptional regulator
MTTPLKEETHKNHHLIAILEVLKTGYWYDKKVQSVLKPFGISHEQFNVLQILHHHHPRHFSLKEIQSRLMNKTPNTTRLVEKLRQKGYIESAYSTSNRRTLEISITEAGQELLKKIKKPLSSLGAKINIALSD